MSDVGEILRAEECSRNLENKDVSAVFPEWDHARQRMLDAFEDLVTAPTSSTEADADFAQAGELLWEFMHHQETRSWSARKLTSHVKTVAKRHGRPSRRQVKTFKREATGLVRLSKLLIREIAALPKQSVSLPGALVAHTPSSSVSVTTSSTRSEPDSMLPSGAPDPTPTGPVNLPTGAESFFKPLLERCTRVMQNLRLARQTRDTALQRVQLASDQYKSAFAQLQATASQYSEALQQVLQLQAQLGESERAISEISDQLKGAATAYVSVEQYNTALDRAKQWQQVAQGSQADIAEVKREQGERDGKLAHALIIILDSVAPPTMQDGTGKSSGKHEHVELLEQTITNQIHKVLIDTWGIYPMKIEPLDRYIKGAMEIEERIDDRSGKHNGCVAQLRRRGYVLKDGNTTFRPARVAVYQ